MTTYAHDDLKKILALHRKWLFGEDGGTRADLTGAGLRGAVLTGADLRDAVLTGADLTGADLRGADLRGAVLTRAVLTGADLRDADLTGAVLSGTVRLSAVTNRTTGEARAYNKWSACFLGRHQCGGR